MACLVMLYTLIPQCTNIQLNILDSISVNESSWSIILQYGYTVYYNFDLILKHNQYYEQGPRSGDTLLKAQFSTTMRYNIYCLTKKVTISEGLRPENN